VNNAIQLEDKVSCSWSKHEGESSPLRLRQALSRTRGSSQRQLPTDHDYAVSTREYQLDQSSPYMPRLPLTLSSFPNKRPAQLDRSLHINASAKYAKGECTGTSVTTQTGHIGYKPLAL
jgi:hypothetical protein